jgi:hypothetical protein
MFYLLSIVMEHFQHNSNKEFTKKLSCILAAGYNKHQTFVIIWWVAYCLLFLEPKCESLRCIFPIINKNVQLIGSWFIIAALLYNKKYYNKDFIEPYTISYYLRVVNDRNQYFGRYRNFGHFGYGKNSTDTDTERCFIPIPKPIPKDETFSVLKVFNLALN